MLTHRHPTSDDTRHHDAALTEREAAAILGYQPCTLRVWRRQGRGPAYLRVRRSIRYLLADLDVWRAAHRIDRTEGA